MLFDGQMRGRPMQVKAVAFRPVWWMTGALGSSRPHGMYEKRTWRQVAVRAAVCDVTTKQRVDTTFSKNAIGAPSLVFQGSVTWPRVDTITKRAPFQLQFPFRQWWLHDGKKDLYLDFDFAGGQIAGGVSWPVNRIRAYPVSGYETGLAAQAGGAQFVDPEARHAGLPQHR